MASPLLSNNLEGGNSGTALTAGSGGNTGGASGNFFDAVTIGSGATLAFDNTHSAHGALSLKVATGASAVGSQATWTASITGGPYLQMWFRVYLYFTAIPITSNNTGKFFTWNTGAANAGAYYVNTSGKIVCTDSAGTIRLTSATTIPLNQWFRVEGWMIGSATVGQTSFSLFTSPQYDTDVVTETQTSAASLNTSGTLATADVGLNSAIASAGPYWVDDPAISVTGPLGPFVAAGKPGNAQTLGRLGFGPNPQGPRRLYGAPAPASVSIPANVTGVGATINVAGGVGTPAGDASTAGVGALVSVQGGIGTPAGAASTAGVGAQINVAGGIGTPAGGASTAGVGALVSVQGGVGTPAGDANVTGVGAQINVAGGIGTPSGSATGNVTGVGAQINVAGGLGTPAGSASVIGVGATINVAGGVGAPVGAANVAGVGAAVHVAGGIGTPAGAANVTGVGAPISVQGGVGTPKGAANVTGVGAQINVQGGIGTPSGSSSANVTGVGATLTVAGGVGTPAGSANVQGVAALISVQGGIGTPAAGVNVTGSGAQITVQGGIGFPSGGMPSIVITTDDVLQGEVQIDDHAGSVSLDDHAGSITTDYFAGTIEVVIEE